MHKAFLQFCIFCLDLFGEHCVCQYSPKSFQTESALLLEGASRRGIAKEYSCSVLIREHSDLNIAIGISRCAALAVMVANTSLQMTRPLRRQEQEPARRRSKILEVPMSNLVRSARPRPSSII